MERDADRLAQYHTGRKIFLGMGLMFAKFLTVKKLRKHTHYVTAD